jgi:hypothetical protein
MVLGTVKVTNTSSEIFLELCRFLSAGAVLAALHYEFRVSTTTMESWGSLVSILSEYRLDDRGSDPQQRQRIFPLASVYKPAQGPTQPPIQWVLGVLYQG